MSASSNNRLELTRSAMAKTARPSQLKRVFYGRHDSQRSAMTVLAFLLVAAQALRASEVARDVDPSKLRGASLCLDNADGSFLLVDAPGPEWRWLTYDRGSVWFAVRKRGETWTDHLYLEQLPTGFQEAQFVSWLTKEHGPGGRRGGTLEHDVQVASVDRSDTPETGSLRVVLELRYRGGHVIRVACYLTPRRYFLEGLLGELPPAQRFAAFLGSYRVRESCVQPAP
jgi:hypothetical protein